MDRSLKIHVKHIRPSHTGEACNSNGIFVIQEDIMGTLVYDTPHFMFLCSNIDLGECHPEPDMSEGPRGMLSSFMQSHSGLMPLRMSGCGYYMVLDKRLPVPHASKLFLPASREDQTALPWINGSESFVTLQLLSIGSGVSELLTLRVPLVSLRETFDDFRSQTVHLLREHGDVPEEAIQTYFDSPWRDMLQKIGSENVTAEPAHGARSYRYFPSKDDLEVLEQVRKTLLTKVGRETILLVDSDSHKHLVVCGHMGPLIIKDITKTDQERIIHCLESFLTDGFGMCTVHADGTNETSLVVTNMHPEVTGFEGDRHRIDQDGIPDYWKDAEVFVHVVSRVNGAVQEIYSVTTDVDTVQDALISVSGEPIEEPDVVLIETRAQEMCQTFFSHIVDGHLEEATDCLQIVYSNPITREEAKSIWVRRMEILKEHGLNLKDFLITKVNVWNYRPHVHTTITTEEYGLEHVYNVIVHFTRAKNHVNICSIGGSNSILIYALTLSVGYPVMPWPLTKEE